MKNENIPTAEIVISKSEMRSAVASEGIEDLAKSIKKYGVIEPIVVRKADDKFVIVCGVRRYLASKMAEIPEVPCRITEVDEKEADILTLHENIIREDVGVLDEAQYYDGVMRRHEMNIDDLSAMIHRSADYIRRRVAALAWPPDLQVAANSKRVSFAVARELAKFDNLAALKRFLIMAIDGGATARVISGFKKQYDNEIQTTGGDPVAIAEKVATEEIIIPPVLCERCGLDLNNEPQQFIRTCSDCHRDLERAWKVDNGKPQAAS